jgi:hypothetical protein
VERVFIVQHKHTLQSEFEDWKMIGVYRTFDDAKSAVDRLSMRPGFAKHPNIIDPEAPGEEDGFYVSEHQLDHDNWTEGFVTMNGHHEYEE